MPLMKMELGALRAVLWLLAICLMGSCSPASSDAEDRLLDDLDASSTQTILARVDTLSYAQGYTNYETALFDALEICLAEVGFEAPSRPPPSFESVTIADTIEERETYGFGFMTRIIFPEHFETRSSSAAVDPQAGMSESERAEYSIEYGKCFGTAAADTDHLVPQNVRLSDDMEQRFAEALELARSSPELVDARDAYSDCMSGKGYPQLTPETVTSDGLPPDFFEKLNGYQIEFTSTSGGNALTLADVFDQAQIDEIYRLADLETDVATANLICSTGLLLTPESVLAARLKPDN